jgi:hypothetical protein
MNLHLDENLKTEKKQAKERLAHAKCLSDRINFHYKLLPIDMVPDIKMRIYDHCGFFSFYRTKGDIHKRPVFCVADDPSTKNGKSPLLSGLEQMFDGLWEIGRTP